MKKVLPFIFIIIILTAFFGPFSARRSYAVLCTQEQVFAGICIKGEEAPAGTIADENDEENLNGSCNPLNWDTVNCVLSAGTLIVEYAIWTPVNLFTAIGGWAMDTSINLTVTGSIFSGLANEKNGVVSAGWGLSRDIVNIFLIFILLYIAIATILQLSGYGAKQLLITLIVIAFLVNFSGVITKMIIDASNVLAMGFYNSFPQENGQIKISKTFKDAFNMEKIITADFTKILEEAETPPRDIYIITFLTYILGAGIAAIAGFIFIIFAVLFLIRMVVLLILLILSPLAFGAMILPSTKSHAKKWWDTLFHQAFFAPAAMFMLWISAKMATSTFIKNVFNLPPEGIANYMALAKAKDPLGWDSIAKFVVQFVIIAIMLFASIIVAKQMGAIGADAVQKGVTKGLRKAQGYAGRIGRKYGTMAIGRASEGLLKAGVGRVPVVGRGLAKLSGMEGERKKKQIEKYKKGYSNYSQAGLDALENDPTIFGARRDALKEVIAERKAKEKKKEKTAERKITQSENVAERAGLEENLENARVSGNIMDIMVAQAKIQLFTTKVAESRFEEVEEKIEEAKEIAEEVKATAEKTKKTAEETKKTEETKPSTPKT